MEPLLLPLRDMIDYSADQIRSRIVSQSLNINPIITIYALDKGESISLEQTNQIKLLLILEGTLNVSTSQNDWTIQTGELLVIPVKYFHAIQASEQCKYLQIELPERKNVK